MLGERRAVPLDGLPVAALDGAREREVVLDHATHERVERLRGSPRRSEELAGDETQCHEVVRVDSGSCLVERASVVVEGERAESEDLGEGRRDGPGALGLSRHGRPGAVELLGPAVVREGYAILLRVLYPACPHTAWALWRELGFEAAHGDLLDTPWPQVDEAALVQSEIELMLQVNGKLRGSIRVAADAGKHTIEVAALKSPEFIKFSEGKRAKKVIVVPGRLVNVVV